MKYSFNSCFQPFTSKQSSVTNKDLLCVTGKSAQCHVAAWMGGEFGGEWIHGYVWLSPFTVHLNVSQPLCVNLLHPTTKLKL